MVATSESIKGRQMRAGMTVGLEQSPTEAARFAVERGSPHPLGAVPGAEGVNFSVFSEHATAVTLLLFNEHDDPEPIQTVKFDPQSNKSFHFWHAFVRGARPGMHY